MQHIAFTQLLHDLLDAGFLQPPLPTSSPAYDGPLFMLSPPRRVLFESTRARPLTAQEAPDHLANILFFCLQRVPSALLERCKTS